MNHIVTKKGIEAYFQHVILNERGILKPRYSLSNDLIINLYVCMCHHHYYRQPSSIDPIIISSSLRLNSSALNVAIDYFKSFCILSLCVNIGVHSVFLGFLPRPKVSKIVKIV